MQKQSFSEETIEIIRDIPHGKVMTYGGIAAAAGNPRAARQVVRVLHSCSESEDLPWWRVINAAGQISLPEGNGFEEQCDLLEAEGVEVSASGRIRLDEYLWKPNGL